MILWNQDAYSKSSNVYISYNEKFLVCFIKYCISLYQKFLFIFKILIFEHWQHGKMILNGLSKKIFL